MNKDRYQKLNQFIHNNFSDQIDRYPLSFAILETELRNEIVGEKYLAQKNAARLSKNYKIIDLMTDFIMRKRFTTKSVYIELPGFKQLREQISFRMTPEFQIFSQEYLMIKNRNKILHKIGTKGVEFSNAMTTASQLGLQNTLKKYDLLEQLEKKLRDNVEDQKKFIKNNGIKIFISSNESKPFAKLLLTSARELSIPYITVCHGYIGHPELITIAPIQSDKLIVWSEIQANNLREIIPERANDIVSFGNPKILGTPTEQKNPDNILLAWEPLYIDMKPSERATHIDTIKKIGAFSKSYNKKFYFKPHPKERHNKKLKKIANSNNFIWVDDLDCYSVFQDITTVISPNSSVLYEAYSYGLKSYQIQNLKTGYIEGAIVAPLSDILQQIKYPEKARKCQQIRNSFCFEEFLALIKSHINT